MKIAQSLAVVALLVALVNSIPVCAADELVDGYFVIGPNYTNAPELTIKEGVPHGTLHVFTMNSEDSKLYPGIAKNQPGVVPYRRQVCVYVPKQYVAGTPAPFIVVQDGMGYTNLLPRVLDNMIQEKRLPTMIAVMAVSAGSSTIRSQTNTRRSSRRKCCRASRRTTT